MPQAHHPSPRVGLTVGERIKLARQSRRMSQATLGYYLGMDKREVRRMESGGLRPGSARLTRIALILGLPLASLVLPTVIRPQSPVSRQRRNHQKTVCHGGYSWGRQRHWQPVRTT